MTAAKLFQMAKIGEFQNGKLAVFLGGNILPLKINPLLVRVICRPENQDFRLLQNVFAVPR